jgi:autoinducer 2 (AI-2) kinase
MRHTTIVLDEAGQAILATPNRDARAAGECMELASSQGDEYYQRTGHWPNPVFMASRLLWLARQRPEDLKQASTAVSLSDWIAYRLSGEIATDFSQAGETMLFDLEKGEWAWDLVDPLGLPRAIFPQVLPAGTKLGTLTKEAADTLGLSPGIPVCVGGGDTQCGLLGTGAIRPGQMAAVAGTTTPLQMATDKPLIDAQKRLWTGCHVIPGVFVLESNAGSTGEALEWFAGAFYPEAANPCEVLSAEASKSVPGAVGILSSVGADVMNACQMSLPVGNLTLTHLTSVGDPARRRHLARAILEGMAYSIKANAEQILEVAGGELGDIRLTGGMSQSPVWSQIVSDVLQVPVYVPATPEATALGAAICAGVGSDVYDDLGEGSKALGRAVFEYTPDEDAARVYRGLYSSWQDLRRIRSEADALASGVALQALVDRASPAEADVEPVFRPRVLITADLDEDSLDRLRGIGDVTYASYREEMRLLTGSELVEELADYHVFVTEVDVVDGEAVQQLPDLRAVFVCRGNPVNVDVSACSALGVPVINTPGRNAEAVADLTLAFMLMLGRWLQDAITFLIEPGGEAGDVGRMAQAHDALQGRELWGKTVGLVGLGAVGQMVAQRLHPFGAKVISSDPFVTREDAALVGVELVSLETLLEQSDYVSLHAAVTDKTRGMIGQNEIGRMKQGAFVINTARAALIDQDALLEALQSGRLGGAGLDVFPVEPPASDDPLLALPNVIATPHVGGNTYEVAVHQGRMVVEDLLRLLHGEHPKHVTNPETMSLFKWKGPREQASPEDLAEMSRRPAPAVTDLDQAAEAAAEPVPDPPKPAAREEEQAPAREKPSGLGRLRDRLRRKGKKDKPSSPTQGVASGAGMERVLRAFLTRIANDSGLADFAQGRQVTMLFTLSDTEQEFFMRFADGEVTADLGPPPVDPDVRLKMKADILDGMFTGRINAMRAAMGGKLSFSGDTKLAMGFQRIQGDLGRLYTEAREETGGPGDLTAIAEPAPVETSKPIAKEVQPERTGDLRDEILEVLQELYGVGCITATGGNISVRIPGTDEIWITPSQVFKGDLRPQSMVRLNLDGKVLDPDALSPSSEWPMHCAVYRERPDVEAVIHTHAPQTTVLMLSGLPFLPISIEAALLGDPTVVPFIMPGTNELAEAVVDGLGDGTVVLMQNHGLLVASGSLRRAANLTEIVERTAEVIVGCYAVGKEPPTLPDETVETLREMGKMMG